MVTGLMASILYQVSYYNYEKGCAIMRWLCEHKIDDADAGDECCMYVCIKKYNWTVDSKFKVL